jgi:TRAP-type C4-dicarboxylate transport system permease small subunit
VIDRAIAALTRAAAPLVLALSLLLFLQWPLRDLVQAYSREANDLAQVFFALYVAVAITAATRARAHLAADALARRFGARTRRWLWRIACIAVLVPASLLILYAGSDVWRSIAVLERFPDTLNPGYFLIRFAAVLLAALVLVQALVDLARREPAA